MHLKNWYLLCVICSCLSSPCAGADRLHSRLRPLKAHRLRKHPRHPSSNVQDLQETQAAVKEYFRHKSHHLPAHTAARARQGIVFCAGGGRLLANAFVSIKVIREAFRSELPIEVFYFGKEEEHVATLTALKDIRGVFVQDAGQLPRPPYLGPWPAKLHDYAKKVFSLFSSRFDQVLMLDADNQLLVTPDTLFDLPEFKQHGAVFWPDYWTAGAAEEAPKAEGYSALGLPVPWQSDSQWACTESGQILFDRVRHVDALDWVMFIQLWSDIMYKHVLGDKDTFEMGFMLAEKHNAFYRVPTPPRAAFTGVQPDGLLLHVGMVQSIDGMPSFLHRTSGGKFDPAKDTSQHRWPVSFTEPMSVPAAKHYIWDVALAINTLQAFDVTEDPPSCEQLDVATKAALRRALAVQAVGQAMLPIARRYASCELRQIPRQEVPIPLLPIAVYGEGIASAINHSFTAFQELRLLLKWN